LLQDKFGFDCIGSGKMLRERSKIKDFTGKKIAQFIDKGKKVPTPIIFNMWMNRMAEIEKDQKNKGFIIDGSPRAVFEAEMLKMALDWYNWDKSKKVIYLKLSDQQIRLRLLNRRMCQNCNALIPFLPEFKNLTKCNRCGGVLIKRADDTSRGIQERIAWFKKEVLPVVRYYKKESAVLEINGEQAIEKVFLDILKALKIK
ncbi:nucleoside monophosphate kinase, partial [Candidatus Gribaldobacteria bacterium]|nr:nucleoside monophosphate kinase [Candidatus Gribaldobacteria bacterium]